MQPMAGSDDVAIFEAHRAALKRLAYRMLGDTASAEDVVQEAWLRWQGRDVVVDNPRSYLLTVTARLCLNQLDSARARREDLRTWLPEPIDVEDDASGLEIMEQVSMAFLVALQRLTPAERAVLLLHEVFDLSHAEIARLLAKTEANTRQILKRAREGVASQRGVATASHDDHRRLLRAFGAAARDGDLAALTTMLADDALLITDGGPTGVRAGRVKNLARPLRGAKKIAAFVTAADARAWQDSRDYVLNGQPALVAFRDGRPLSALFLAIADGRITQIFIQADADRLRRIVAS
jgi:RNA polymerase sigma-70 factor (ECF subfamily)